MKKKNGISRGVGVEPRKKPSVRGVWIFVLHLKWQTYPGLAPWGVGGDSNIKKVRVLIVSLRGVNFSFWSRLGC